MPLFNKKTIDAALAGFGREPTSDEIALAQDWGARARGDFEGQNESQLEQEFNRIIVQGLLGYVPPTPAAPGTMKVKQQVGAGIVDVALGHFTAFETKILAPLELKGPKVGLDNIMPGRARTPVQQAWEYANDAVGARWVLVSNMKELRLYAVGYGRAAHEHFDLARLDEGDLKRLLLLLHAEQFLSGATAALLVRSATKNREITDELYRDYRKLRDDLVQFVTDQRPGIGAESRIALVQKLLDRLIFVAFAEKTVLIPDNSIESAVKFRNPYDPKPKWQQIRSLFDAVSRLPSFSTLASRSNIPGGPVKTRGRLPLQRNTGIRAARPSPRRSLGQR
jgi:hypothetical protein